MSVAMEPKMISGRAQPVSTLLIIQPINKPGIPAVVKIGKAEGVGYKGKHNVESGNHCRLGQEVNVLLLHYSVLL